jgi:hypothetical protein
MDVLRGRLALRLGADHGAVRELGTATDALLAIDCETGKPSHLVDVTAQLAAVQTAGWAIEDAQRKFIAAAVDTAGARLT